MNKMLRLIAALAFGIAALVTAVPASAQDKVVYHFDAGISQATKGLRNIRNHLDVDPKAQIITVAHAEGVDFLMEGAKSTNNQEFASLVGDLSARGVKFEICEITLKRLASSANAHVARLVESAAAAHAQRPSRLSPPALPGASPLPSSAATSGLA